MKHLVGVIALLVGLGMLGVGAGELASAYASRSWPSATGVIQSSNRHAREHCIGFSYEVGGQFYSSVLVFLHQESWKSGTDPSCEAATLERYPVGRRVAVFYDPRRPGHGVLERGPSDAMLFILGAGALFALAGTASSWKLLS